MPYGYGYTVCGCPIYNNSAHHLPGCTGSRPLAPSRPQPPPIGPGSRVRLINVFHAEGGLSSTEVYTVEAVQHRGGTTYLRLIGDSRPWKAERFTAEL